MAFSLFQFSLVQISPLQLVSQLRVLSMENFLMKRVYVKFIYTKTQIQNLTISALHSVITIFQTCLLTQFVHFTRTKGLTSLLCVAFSSKPAWLRVRMFANNEHFLFTLSLLLFLSFLTISYVTTYNTQMLLFCLVNKWLGCSTFLLS